MHGKSPVYAKQKGRQMRNVSEGTFLMHLPWLLRDRYDDGGHRENVLGARKTQIVQVTKMCLLKGTMILQENRNKIQVLIKGLGHEASQLKRLQKVVTISAYVKNELRRIQYIIIHTGMQAMINWRKIKSVQNRRSEEWHRTQRFRDKQSYGAHAGHKVQECHSAPLSQLH